MKKTILLSYSAPELEIFEVAVDRGYGDSDDGTQLPGFGTEEGGELIY